MGGYATKSLIGEIATAVGAILCSIISSLIIKYTYALADVSALTMEDKKNKKNRKPNEMQIKHFTSKNISDFTEEMIVNYALSIYHNNLKNRNKAIAVLIGQCAFFVSIIFALILIIILIQAFNAGEFSLPSVSSSPT